MDIFDDQAVYFEIPATDSLGREAVAGKVRATRHGVFFHWRYKDRTFRKSDGEMAAISIPFEQVERIAYKSTLGFKPRMIFQVADPKLLESVPGVDVGKATLMLEKSGKADVNKFIKFLDFKKAEAQAAASRRRLNNLEDDLDPDKSI